MKFGGPIAIFVTIFGLGAMMFAFLVNSSPYVSVAEARELDANNLHIAGDIIRETVFVDIRNNQVRFTMVDKAGDRLNVVFDGPPPSNMGEATEVVAIGGMEGDSFRAHRMQLKCPSKYESVTAESGV